MFQEALRNDPSSMGAIGDCKTCMRTTTQHKRQTLGCGYEPRIAAALVHPWRHKSIKGKTPYETCPGYTTRLPQVVEVARTRMHWEKGIADLSDEMRLGIEILEASVGDLQVWLAKPKSKGGGGPG